MHWWLVVSLRGNVWESSMFSLNPLVPVGCCILFGVCNTLAGLQVDTCSCSHHNLCDPYRGQCQAGSLTGAVHLSKGNAGVLRLAQ